MKIHPPDRQKSTASGEPSLRIDTRRLREIQAAYAKERSEAHSLIPELRKHPKERQRVMIRNHPRFQTWGVLEGLLEASRQETLGDPDCGEELALLATDVAEHLDATTYGAEGIEDLKARAWAYIGNARRVRFDLREAQEAFDRSLIHLRQGTREPWEHAVWMDLKASLLRAQRRFDDSKRLLKRALVLFLAVGDRHRAGRVLISMDNVLHREGRPEEGIPFLYKALELIDSEQEPHVLFMATHNLIDDLAEAGRYMEAQRLLIQSRPLYQRFDRPFVRYRCRWTEAKIARGFGQLKKAEAFMETARSGFLEYDAAFEVALVSLELAGLYAEQGKTSEMKCLAEEMVSIFSSRQIHREALAALALWKQAVDAEEACAELAALVAAEIKHARYDQPASGQEGL
jgi:tetratricopeptide (TPR) repeat protein